MMIPGPRAPMAERNVQDPIPAYIKLVASKIHTKTSNVWREKIINYLALAKYTLALFLIRRCKNQRHQSFHLQECSWLTSYGWSCRSQMSRLLTRTIISMLRAQATEVFWGTRQARQLKGSSAHIYQVGKVLVHVESPSDRGVLVQGPKTNRRQGGCDLLYLVLSLLTDIWHI